VTTLAELGNDPLFFFVNSIAGFVIRNDGNGDAGTKEPVIAMSAACTDQSCILQWQKADQKYLCPCHGALFTEYGKVDKNTPPVYKSLPPLPRLDVKVVGDQVLVRVPAIQTSKK
jgi:cytochrome b6-f complex iron-sulfur subunit